MARMREAIRGELARRWYRASKKRDTLQYV